MNYEYGSVVYRRTCRVCGRRRACRADIATRYPEWKFKGNPPIILVCMDDCSRFTYRSDGKR